MDRVPDVVSKPLAAACLTVLLVALSRSPHAQAADPTDWVVTWYLCHEFSTGHPGQTMFIVPDGSGGIWTNSTDFAVSRLWHISGDTLTCSFTVQCPSDWGRVDDAGRGAWGEWDPFASTPKPRRQPDIPKGPEGTRWERIRGLMDAALMPDGRLWVATAEGLIELDGTETTFYAQVPQIAGFGPSFFHYSDSVPPLSTRPTTALAVDGYGELWAYSEAMGLIRRPGAGSEKYPRYGVWSKYLAYLAADGSKGLDYLLDDEAVTVIRAPRKGEVIAGTASGGLLILKQEKEGLGTSVALGERISAETIGASGPVTDIMRDSKGRLWCTHQGEKLADQEYRGSVAMLDGGRWTVWDSRNSALPPRPVTTICEVRPDTVWAGVNWLETNIYAGGTRPETGLFELVDHDWVTVHPRSYWAQRHKVVGVDPKYWKQDITNESTRGITLIRVDDRGRVWVGSEAALACFEVAG